MKTFKNQILPIKCAIGILINKENKVLISKRQKFKEGGGLWEFPGGKIEKNESAKIALMRELQEEIGVHALTCKEFMTLYFEYTQSISSCDEAPVKASSGAYELVCEQRPIPLTKSQLERRRVYPSYSVLLEIFLVHEFTGQPCGLEGQIVQWVEINKLKEYDFLEGNKKIIDALEKLS